MATKAGPRLLAVVTIVTMLLLAPFDFTQIYRKRMAQEQAEQTAAETATV